MLPTTMHFKYKWVKSKSQKNRCHGNTYEKKDKVYFKEKTSRTLKKKNNFIIIKGSIHQKDTIVLHFSVPNNRALKCMKQKLIKVHGEKDKSTIITRDFYTLSQKLITQENIKQGYERLE